ncbi:MAG: hypothetical protein RBS08_03270 [Bdellovibrionales bacterium]|jgi:hypothetical protein|nr:hypothetical protein [Bdellovibrionales bacterium]
MTKMRSFVEYIVTSKGTPAGAAIVHEVQDRDLGKLSIPPNAYELYFFDSPTQSANPYDAQNDQHNCSAFYLIASRVITSEEAGRQRRKNRAALGAKKAAAKKHHTGKKPAAKCPSARKRILGMTQNQLSEKFWQVSLMNHDHFAVTRQGHLMPVRKDNIVINDRGEQLFPLPAPIPAPQDIALISLPPLRKRKNKPGPDAP